MNNWLKNSLLLVRGACYTHFSPFLLSYLRYSSFLFLFFLYKWFRPMPRSPSRVPIFPFPLAFPIICCHFSYPLPVYHFTFVFHYLNWLFPVILPHCRVHSLEQGRAKNGEQADAAELVVKETFFFAILLISRGPFFVCPHLARFRWLRAWNKETLPTASHTADKFFCSLNKFSG